MGIAEDWQLENELKAGAQAKPVHLLNNSPTQWPVGYIQADPNKTVSDLPHGDVIREKLRAKVKDLNADPQDRAQAIEALRIMYREKV